MANSITQAGVYSKAIDEKYRQTAKTILLEKDNVLLSDAGKLLIPKVDLEGTIAPYNRTNGIGYNQAFISTDYQEIKKDIDLGISVAADYVDNADSGHIAFNEGCKLATDLFIPAIDALRFSSICQKEGVTEKQETLTTGKQILASLREATTAMYNKNVPTEKRITFALKEVIAAIEDMDSYVSKAVLNELGHIVIVTPEVFSTKFELDSTVKAGYKKSEGAKDLNYLIVNSDAVLAKVKSRCKIIDAASNQNTDDDVMRIRMYGLSAYVYDNKADSIYLSTK